MYSEREFVRATLTADCTAAFRVGGHPASAWRPCNVRGLPRAYGSVVPQNLVSFLPYQQRLSLFLWGGTQVHHTVAVLFPRRLLYVSTDLSFLISFPATQ